jgi:hypothetical protein
MQHADLFVGLNTCACTSMWIEYLRHAEMIFFLCMHYCPLFKSLAYLIPLHAGNPQEINMHPGFICFFACKSPLPYMLACACRFKRGTPHRLSYVACAGREIKMHAVIFFACRLQT